MNRLEAINLAYSNLKEATTDYYAAQVRKAEAKFVYDATFQSSLAIGEIVGRNEAERAGEMRKLWPDLVMGLQKAVLEEMGKEMAYRVCRLEVDRIVLIVNMEKEQDGYNLMPD